MRKLILPVLTLLLFAVSALYGRAEEVQKKVIIKGKGKPALGVVIMDVSEERLKELNLNGGAEIRKVIDGSEAEKIGLKKGDIIVKFDGNDVAGPDDLKEMVSDIEEKKTVSIVVNRDGKEMKFEAVLEPKDDDRFMVWNDDDGVVVDMDDFEVGPHHLRKLMPSCFGSSSKGGFLGVKVKELSEQLRDYFEVEHGVLIEEVVEDSPASKAGLKAGDVILEIEGRKIEDYRDLVRTLNYYNPGEQVKVKYSRKGKPNSITVTLGKKKGMSMHFKSGDNNFDFEFDDNLKELEEELQGVQEKLKKIDVEVVVL